MPADRPPPVIVVVVHVHPPRRRPAWAGLALELSARLIPLLAGGVLGGLLG